MSSRTLSDWFCSPAPVYRPEEIPTCPFEEELLPANADFIYDMARMEHESIDNYANMLCYTIPSLGAIVFFRWVEYVCITLDDLGQMEVDHVMELERAMGKHGSENEELYTLLPCSYEESLSFYQRLMVSQEGHRALLGQLFKRRGVYEKYKPFVDGYEAVFGQREFKARVTYASEPSSTIIQIFEVVQGVAHVSLDQHRRSNSADSFASSTSEQVLWFQPKWREVSSDDLTPRPNRAHFD